jgi:hypothetical protein
MNGFPDRGHGQLITRLPAMPRATVQAPATAKNGALELNTRESGRPTRKAPGTYVAKSHQHVRCRLRSSAQCPSYGSRIHGIPTSVGPTGFAVPLISTRSVPRVSSGCHEESSDGTDARLRSSNQLKSSCDVITLRMRRASGYSRAGPFPSDTAQRTFANGANPPRRRPVWSTSSSPRLARDSVATRRTSSLPHISSSGRREAAGGWCRTACLRSALFACPDERLESTLVPRIGSQRAA